ncbi:unnamed protein product [Prorocentrum cordatum]|uniref:Uncharacterized protein n=1 Tax=Prorocentrum cordatum TaxID=2364126 RepID=A0ABN9VA91_9DINO|nr:unnamed protein product [Polarella glacialis]
MPPARLRPAELSADGGGAGCALPKDEPLGSTSRGSTAASSTTAASLDGCGSFERGSSPPSTRRSTSRERYEETLDFPVELATAAPPTPDGPPCRAAPLAETRRLTAALREMAALLDLEPRSLRECVRAVAEQGWKNITWRKRCAAAGSWADAR